MRAKVCHSTLCDGGSVASPQPVIRLFLFPADSIPTYIHFRQRVAVESLRIKYTRVSVLSRINVLSFFHFFTYSRLLSS